MQIEIPEQAIIALIGEEGEIKSNFAKKYFKKEEFVLLGSIIEDAARRLDEAKLTVVDMNEYTDEISEEIVKLSKRYHCRPIAIVLDVTEENKERSQGAQNLSAVLQKKGFRQIEILNGESLIEKAQVYRTKLANNKREIHGPFDIIGDIHGCYDELCKLLEQLGYEVECEKHSVQFTPNRILVFLGDLVDRGPKSADVLKLVMNLVETGHAYCVMGNHDGKLLRKLKGSNVQVAHGLEKTMEQLETESEMFIEEVKEFLEHLVGHYVFDDGRLVVAHAGLKERLQGRESKRVKDLAMFGETTGQLDERGLPQRLNWSEYYKGHAFVVYGHTPQLNAKLINNTINIDTGCVFGGKLTAFRYPEKEIVEVKAKISYYEAVRPLAT